MYLVEIFYCSFWISTLMVIWFYTDWFIHYSQLFDVMEDLKLKYTSFIKDNPSKYMPDFLYERSLLTNNRFKKFILKLVSCPFCLGFWLAVIASLGTSNIITVAPIYIISLFLVLQIKKML